MSAVVQTNRGGMCGICREVFTPGALQLTHVGGEGHDGFHKDCLVQWLKRQLICPIEKQRIEPGSLLSRTDRTMQKLKPALASAAYAALFGLAAGIGTSITAGHVASAAMAVEGLGIALTSEGVGIAASAAVAVGELGVALALEIPIAPAIVMLGGGVGIGLRTNLTHVLARRGLHRIARENIGFGLQLGAIAALARAILIPSLTPISFCLEMALASGIATGALSLIR